MIRKCQQCHRNFPEELIAEFTSGRMGSDEVLVAHICPLCAQDIINKAYDLPANAPLRGVKAEAMRIEALKHLQKTGQG